MNSYELNSALSLDMAFRCGLVAILFIAIPASVLCLRCISCQCGLSSIHNTHCTENGSTERFSCEKWAGCQTCRDNSTYCVACPNNRSGPFCKDDAVPIKHGHRQKRIYVSSSCEKPGQFYNGILQIYPPMNAPIGSVDDTELPAGTRLFYSCYKGFELHGKANQICEDSFWSAEPPTCIKEKQPARCPDPGIPAGASRESVDGADESAARNYLEGEALYFYCDDEDYVIEGAYVLNCTSFGNWTDTAPRCRRDEKNGCNDLAHCPNEGPIDHGRVQVSLNLNEQMKCVRDYQFPAGTVLHYSCDEGYVLHRTSEQICQSNGSWSEEKPSCIKDCGWAGHPIRNDSYGHIYSLQFPWMVSIFIKGFDEVCGGVLIDNTTVLTVAHCLQNVTEVTLIFNEYSSQQRKDINNITRESSRILIHPEFNSSSFDNNIAIVKFHPAVMYSDRVQPICLPTLETSAKYSAEFTIGYAIGRGNVLYDTNLSKIQTSDLWSRSTESCIVNCQYEPFVITPSIACGQFLLYEHFRTTLSSGYPIVYPNYETERFILEGLFTKTPEDCYFEHHFIFSRVSFFLEWILANLEKLESS